ncbi:MAG TPA: hypothetical protein VK966_02950 [Longimicrobiales bacterium]|nr:hypothetical protein [Longimicrobiales bacterium]
MTRVRTGSALIGMVLLAGVACVDQESSAQGVAASDADPALAIIETVRQSDPAMADELERIHAATARYRDVEAALADGYIPDPAGMCITPEMEGMPRQLGGMGIHYFRPDLLGLTGDRPRVTGTGTHTDFAPPSVLVYEPQPGGGLELVAVENLVFRDAWLAENDGPPEFLGNQYFALADNPETEADEAHGFAPHYELHMWLYRENPSGVLAPFNPNVSCEHHAGGDSH